MDYQKVASPVEDIRQGAARQAQQKDRQGRGRLNEGHPERLAR